MLRSRLISAAIILAVLLALSLGAWFVAPLVGVVVVTAGRASTVIVTVAVSFGVKPLVAV